MVVDFSVKVAVLMRYNFLVIEAADVKNKCFQPTLRKFVSYVLSCKLFKIPKMHI